jgi:hypothetical protein
MNNLTLPGLNVENKVLAEVTYNHAEIKARVEEAIAQVKKEVVTEQTLKATKTTMKQMNDLSKELDRFRIDTKKELSVNITAFEDKTKQLVTDIKDARTFLNDQVKKFEDEERERKRQVALLLIEQTTNEIKLNEKYIDMIELKDEYMLAASNKTKVKKLIVEQFKAAKALQDAEQMKINTINMVIGAHNSRLRFKFSFEDFERHINDETSLAELNQIVNDKVNKRLADEQAELERIEKEKLEAIAKAEEEVKRKAREEAVRVAEEEERRHQEELDRIEKEKKEALWRVEFEKSQAREAVELEKRLAEQEAAEQAKKVEQARLEAIRIVEEEKAEALRVAEETRLEAVRVAEEAQAKIVAEAKKLVPKASKQKAQTVVLEIKGNKSQLDALKAYMDEYEIKYTKVEV